MFEQLAIDLSAARPPVPAQRRPTPDPSSPAPDLPHAHRCGARWSGNAVAHCGKCHRNFANTRAFYAHQPGRCRHPRTLGMAELDRPYPCWGYPAETVEDR